MNNKPEYPLLILQVSSKIKRGLEGITPYISGKLYMTIMLSIKYYNYTTKCRKVLDG